MLKGIDHPNIVQLIGSFFEVDAFLVFELCLGKHVCRHRFIILLIAFFVLLYFKYFQAAYGIIWTK